MPDNKSFLLRLSGSKTLGANLLEFQFVYAGKP